MSDTNGTNGNGSNGNGHKPKRRYSDRERAAALVALDLNQGNVYKTARQCGIPRKTLELWTKPESMYHGVADERQDQKEALADMFERIARAYGLHSLDAAVLAKTNGQQAVIGACAATDKMRLLREQPTSIIDERASLQAAIDAWKRDCEWGSDEDAVKYLGEQPAFAQIVKDLGKVG